MSLLSDEDGCGGSSACGDCSKDRGGASSAYEDCGGGATSSISTSTSSFFASGELASSYGCSVTAPATCAPYHKHVVASSSCEDGSGESAKVSATSSSSTHPFLSCSNLACRSVHTCPGFTLSLTIRAKVCTLELHGPNTHC